MLDNFTWKYLYTNQSGRIFWELLKSITSSSGTMVMWYAYLSITSSMTCRTWSCDMLSCLSPAPAVWRVTPGHVICLPVYHQLQQYDVSHLVMWYAHLSITSSSSMTCHTWSCDMLTCLSPAPTVWRVAPGHVICLPVYHQLQQYDVSHLVMWYAYLSITSSSSMTCHTWSCDMLTCLSPAPAVWRVAPGHVICLPVYHQLQQYDVSHLVMWYAHLSITSSSSMTCRTWSCDMLTCLSPAPAVWRVTPGHVICSPVYHQLQQYDVSHLVMWYAHLSITSSSSMTCRTWSCDMLTCLSPAPAVWRVAPGHVICSPVYHQLQQCDVSHLVMWYAHLSITSSSSITCRTWSCDMLTCLSPAPAVWRVTPGHVICSPVYHQLQQYDVSHLVMWYAYLSITSSSSMTCRTWSCDMLTCLSPAPAVWRVAPGYVICSPVYHQLQQYDVSHLVMWYAYLSITSSSSMTCRTWSCDMLTCLSPAVWRVAPGHVICSPVYHQLQQYDVSHLVMWYAHLSITSSSSMTCCTWSCDMLTCLSPAPAVWRVTPGHVICSPVYHQLQQYDVSHLVMWYAHLSITSSMTCRTWSCDMLTCLSPAPAVWRVTPGHVICLPVYHQLQQYDVSHLVMWYAYLSITSSSSMTCRTWLCDMLTCLSPAPAVWRVAPGHVTCSPVYHQLLQYDVSHLVMWYAHLSITSSRVCSVTPGHVICLPVYHQLQQYDVSHLVMWYAHLSITSSSSMTCHTWSCDMLTCLSPAVWRVAPGHVICSPVYHQLQQYDVSHLVMWYAHLSITSSMTCRTWSCDMLTCLSPAPAVWRVTPGHVICSPVYHQLQQCDVSHLVMWYAHLSITSSSSITCRTWSCDMLTCLSPAPAVWRVTPGHVICLPVYHQLQQYDVSHLVMWYAYLSITSSMTCHTWSCDMLTCLSPAPAVWRVTPGHVICSPVYHQLQQYDVSHLVMWYAYLSITSSSSMTCHTWSCDMLTCLSPAPAVWRVAPGHVICLPVYHQLQQYDVSHLVMWYAYLSITSSSSMTCRT